MDICFETIILFNNGQSPVLHSLIHEFQAAENVIIRRMTAMTTSLRTTGRIVIELIR